MTQPLSDKKNPVGKMVSLLNNMKLRLHYFKIHIVNANISDEKIT
jgi:hypothetical protein